MKKIKLEDIDKNQPFKVPDGYFDQLQQSILQRTSNIIAEDTPTISWSQRPVVRYLIAASIILALLFIPISQLLVSETNNDLLADISNEEIIYYIDFYDINEIDLIEAFGEDIEFENTPSTLPEEIELDDESIEMLYLEYGINEI